MEQKPYSVKLRYKLYNILSWQGVILAVGAYLQGGMLKQILPWIGFAMVVAAVVIRFTMVRCPHCGHGLTESKTIPDQCPKCNQELT